MTIKFFERPASGSSTNSPPTATKEYCLTGIDDDYMAMGYAKAGSDTSLAVPSGLLWRQDIQAHHEGHKLWYFTISYAKEKKETGSFKFSFDTSGGTLHVKASKATVAKYPNTAPDHERAIGVDKNGEVQGTDIVIPSLKLNYAFKHPAGIISEAKARYLASVTGMTNSVMWHGYQQGELLLLGATGSDGTDSEAEVTYSVAASKNVTGMTIGAISGIAKKGWEVSWIKFKNAVNANKPVTQPEFIYIERVYDEVDFFAALGF